MRHWNFVKYFKANRKNLSYKWLKLQIKMKIALCGGGTAGHLYPIVAVAEEIKKLEPSASFIFVGSQGGMEETLAPRAGFDFFSIPAGKLRRYFDWQNFIDPIRTVLGIVKALKIFIDAKPDVLFAKGGYVSVPAVIAARILRIPVVLHESDVKPGLANRFLAKIADSVCIAHLSSHSFFPPLKTTLTGNPVRAFFFDEIALAMESNALARNLGFSTSQPIIFVAGGSQGAKKINDHIFSCLDEMLTFSQVLHLVGGKQFQQALEIKEKLPPEKRNKYLPFSFLHEELPKIMNLADLVISRAGAGLISEITALGKPSILIPLTSAANDHQRANAYFVAEAGGAIIFDENERSDELIGKIRLLVENKELLARMSTAAKKIASPGAAKKIAKVIVARALRRKQI